MSLFTANNRQAPPMRGDMVVTKWGAQFRGRRFPCAIGRGGIALGKVEGDGVSPAGAWLLTAGGFRADRLAKPKFSLKATPIRVGDIWSDDIKDPEYNHAVHSHAHPYTHEKLRRADPLYDVFLISDWNYPDAIPGKGSAIFVHHWRKPRHPTEGCIAFAAKDLQWIMARWRPNGRIFVR